jgi:hypothetical protein
MQSVSSFKKTATGKSQHPVKTGAGTSQSPVIFYLPLFFNEWLSVGRFVDIKRVVKYGEVGNSLSPDCRELQESPSTVLSQSREE